LKLGTVVRAGEGSPVQEEFAAGEEVGELIGMLVTGEPVLDPRGRVQRRVAPLQIDRRGGPAPAR